MSAQFINRAKKSKEGSASQIVAMLDRQQVHELIKELIRCNHINVKIEINTQHKFVRNHIHACDFM